MKQLKFKFETNSIKLGLKLKVIYPWALIYIPYQEWGVLAALNGIYLNVIFKTHLYMYTYLKHPI